MRMHKLYIRCDRFHCTRKMVKERHMGAMRLKKINKALPDGSVKGNRENFSSDKVELYFLLIHFLWYFIESSRKKLKV